jgi:hypothetical protein
VLGDHREEVSEQLALARRQIARDLVDRRRVTGAVAGADADMARAIAADGLDGDARCVGWCALQRRVLKLFRYRRPS